MEAVLLEPSFPQSSEPRKPRSLLGRIGHYGRKLYQDGPIVLYQSVRYRLQHYREAPPPHMDAAAFKKWNVCVPHFLRNIATYRPPHPLQDGIHLVAGTGWLARHLNEFQTQLKETPRVCSVSDVTHLDLPNRDECIAVWIQLINEILSASDGGSLPAGSTRRSDSGGVIPARHHPKVASFHSGEMTTASDSVRSAKGTTHSSLTSPRPDGPAS